MALAISACNPASRTVDSTVTLTGKVFGGEQPITASTIQLYAVGTGSTDGGAATPLITATVTTSDGSGLLNANANAGNHNNQFAAGSFTISGDYTCPSSSAQVYIAAVGGNPGGGTNPDQETLGALGNCGNLSSSTTLSINEVTTVGTVAALYPFMSAYNAIGSTTGHATALAAAFNTAAEYIDVGHGSAPGPALSSGYDASSNDLRALANAVQSCVNSTGGTAGDGSSCGHFFTDTTPTSNVAPTDTVGALINLFNNPTTNVTAIFNLQSSSPPFAPTYSSAPTDWTLPIQTVPGTPTFSVAAGSYAGVQSVSITESVSGAAIYYTTDGSAPSSSSTLYSGAVTVTPPETLKAFAVQGRLSSAVAAASYMVLVVTPTVSVSAVSAPNGSTAPVMITATESGSSGTATGGVVTFSVTGPATGTFSPATCTIAYGSCSVSYVPTGVLAAATYTNDVTAAFAAASPYASASTTGTLTVTGTAFSGSTTFNVLASFTGTSGASPGMSPQFDNLMQGSDRSFYGTTYSGGVNSLGTVFKITSTGTYTLLHTFASGTTNGQSPIAGLAEGSDGNFYGTTDAGGANNAGTFFKITPTGTFTLLHSFSTATTDGESPRALIRGSDGNFYGTSAYGGANTTGTVYKMTPAGVLTLVYSFSGATDGKNPVAGVVQGSDGNFYGTTTQGGSSNAGTAFKITPAGVFTLLHTFGSSDGTLPYGGVVQGSDGSFYGTAYSGGASTVGTVYKITSAGVYTVLHTFSNGTDGKNPYGGLVVGSDGNLYGSSYQGTGNAIYGTLFSMSPTGTFTVLYSFTSSAAARGPKGALVQGGDGSFYGTTYSGGANSDGTIFQLTSSPALAAPVTLTVPASVTHGTSFTLGYAVSNAYSTTLQSCFATNTAGDTTVWTGAITGSATAANITLTAPATAGSYSYALTCGGMESGFATLTVQ